jgi:hypothetical protein
MHRSFIILYFACSLLLPFHLSVAQNNSVDQIIEKSIDVTGNGVRDIVSLRLKADNWESPIMWTLEIISGGSIIFRHESNDTWLNQFFNDEGYVNDTCKNYIDCKKQYYLHDLPKNIVVVQKISSATYSTDIHNPGGTRIVAKKELIEKFQLSEQEAEETVEWIVNMMKSGPVTLLSINISPVQTSFPKMYVDKVKDFVVIYEW